METDLDSALKETVGPRLKADWSIAHEVFTPEPVGEGGSLVVHHGHSPLSE